MALELPQNGQQASLRKRGMQGIRLNHWAGKSRTKAALAHPPLVPSTRATLSACGKKRPSGLLAATLHPPAAPPLPNSAPRRYTIQPPLRLDTYTPLAVYAPKRPLYQSNSAQATNCYFCALHYFPCKEAQRWVCKWDVRGCAPSSCSSPGHCPSPCPCPACELLADSWLHCPSSQPGSPVLFQPCLLPVIPSLQHLDYI